jgi:hypothetical protein
MCTELPTSGNDRTSTLRQGPASASPTMFDFTLRKDLEFRLLGESGEPTLVIATNPDNHLAAELVLAQVAL